MGIREQIIDEIKYAQREFCECEYAFKELKENVSAILAANEVQAMIRCVECEKGKEAQQHESQIVSNKSNCTNCIILQTLNMKNTVAVTKCGNCVFASKYMEVSGKMIAVCKNSGSDLLDTVHSLEWYCADGRGG